MRTFFCSRVASYSWFCWLSLLASCTNRDPTTGTTTVMGQVVESQSRKPVGNGTVQVWLTGKGGGYGMVGSAYPCDAQGKFTFAFEAQRTSGYLLKAQAPPGYITDWLQAPSLTAGRQNTPVVVPVLAPAWLRLALVDEPPKSRVTIEISEYSGSGETLSYPRDTVLIRPILANFKTGLLWSINDQGQEKATTLYLQPGSLDTVTVRIAF